MSLRLSPVGLGGASAGLAAWADQLERSARGVVASTTATTDRVTLSSEAQAAVGLPEETVAALIRGQLMYKASGAVLRRVEDAQQSLVDVLA